MADTPVPPWDPQFALPPELPEFAAAPPPSIPAPWERQERLPDPAVADVPENQPIDPFVEPPVEPELPAEPALNPTGAFGLDVGSTQLRPPEILIDTGNVPAQPVGRELSGVAPDLAPSDASQLERPELYPEPTPTDALLAPGEEDVAAEDLSERALYERTLAKRQELEDDAAAQRAEARDALAFEEDALAESEQTYIERLRELDMQREEHGNKRVDPQRYFKNTSTMQRIGGLVTAFMSGMLQVRTGGKNIFLDQLNLEIKRDIDAQMSDLSREGQALDRQVGNVHQLMAMGVRQKQAAYLTYDRTLQEVSQQLNGELSKYAPGGTSAEAIESTMRDLDAQRAAAKMEADKELRAEIREETELGIKIAAEQRAREMAAAKMRKMRGGGSGAGKISGINKKTGTVVADTMRDLNIHPKDRERFVMVDPTNKDPAARGVLAANNTVAKTARNTMAGARNLVRDLDRLELLVKKHGWEPGGERIGTAAGREMAGLHSRLVTALNAEAGLGALTGADLKLLSSQLGGDPSKVGASSGLRALRATRDDLVRKVNGALGDAGIQGRRWSPARPSPRSTESASKPKDLMLKLKSARTQEEQQISTRALINSIKDGGGGLSRKEAIREAIEHLDKIPPHARSILVSEGGQMVSLDPIELLNAEQGLDRARDQRLELAPVDARIEAARKADKAEKARKAPRERPVRREPRRQ